MKKVKLPYKIDKELISTTYYTLDPTNSFWSRVDRNYSLKNSIWLLNDEIHFGVVGHKLRMFKISEIESIELFFTQPTGRYTGRMELYSGPNPHGHMMFVFKNGKKITSRSIKNLYWVVLRLLNQIDKYALDDPKFIHHGNVASCIGEMKGWIIRMQVYPEISYQKWLESLKDELTKLGLN